MAMSIRTAISWSVKMCRLMDDYCRSSEIYTTDFKIEDGDSMLISNVGKFLPAYTDIRDQEMVGTLNVTLRTRDFTVIIHYKYIYYKVARSRVVKSVWCCRNS
jgi:hypothetical protein